MEIKIQYHNLEERKAIIAQHSDKILLEELKLFEGNFLIFGNEPRPSKIIYTQVNAKELEEMETRTEDLELALAEIILGGN